MNSEFPKNYGEIYHGDATDDDIKDGAKSEMKSAEDMLEYAILTKDNQLKIKALKLLKERALAEALQGKKEDAVAADDFKKSIAEDTRTQADEEGMFLEVADKIRKALFSAGFKKDAEVDWAKRRTRILMDKGEAEEVALDTAIKELIKDKGPKKYTGPMTFGIEGGVVNPMERADGPVEK
jgi:hypothetical protein